MSLRSTSAVGMSVWFAGSAILLLALCGRAEAAGKGPPVSFVAPGGGETYIVGQTQRVVLSVQSSIRTVEVRLSFDGGKTYPMVVGSVTNVGTNRQPVQTITFLVPETSASEAMMQATGVSAKGTVTALSALFVIGTPFLGPGSVTTPIIADLSVSTGKLADGAVTTPKIADQAVTNPKIADKAVTDTKVSSTMGGAAGSAATNNFVLTADGLGGAAWVAPLDHFASLYVSNGFNVTGGNIVLPNGTTISGDTATPDIVAVGNAAGTNHVDYDLNGTNVALTGYPVSGAFMFQGADGTGAGGSGVAVTIAGGDGIGNGNGGDLLLNPGKKAGGGVDGVLNIGTSIINLDTQNTGVGRNIDIWARQGTGPAGVLRYDSATASWQVSYDNGVTFNQLLTSATGSFWSRVGNAIPVGGTLAGQNFIGTTNVQDFVVAVNGFQALRISPNNTSPNVVGGFGGDNSTLPTHTLVNRVTFGAIGATIAGGGKAAGNNIVTDDFGTIAGGVNNQAGNNAGTNLDASGAAVGGGENNAATGMHSTVSGGISNTASGVRAAIAGGNNNTASGQAAFAAGASNTASGFGAVAMGQNTTAQASGSVALGQANVALAPNSFALGQSARVNSAIHNGTFVYADSQVGNFDSTAQDQFLIRAAGGVGINKNNPAAGTLDVNGNIITNGLFIGNLRGNVSNTPDLTLDALNGTAYLRAAGAPGTARVVLKPFAGGSNSATAIQLQEGGGTAIVNVDTTNGRVAIGNPASAAPGSRLVVAGGNAGSTTSSAMNVTDNASTSLLYVRDDGYVGLSQTTPDARLTVRGVGSGGAATTNALNVTDSAAASILRVRDDGLVAVGGDPLTVPLAPNAFNPPPPAGNPKLWANGSIYARSGGYYFPDGSLQVTAAQNIAWILDGNDIDVAGKFFGTTAASTIPEIDMKVADNRVMRYESGIGNPNSLYGVNILGGHAVNSRVAGVLGATIAGGGASQDAISGVASPNSVTDHYGTVGGGSGNRAGDNAFPVSNKPYATVGGGHSNVAGGFASTVAGGENNAATGDYSFAAGQRAKAATNGAFVWADSQAADFTSTVVDSFIIRAQGGIGINKANPAANTLDVTGALAVTGNTTLASGGGSVTTIGNATGALTLTGTTIAVNTAAGTTTVGNGTSALGVLGNVAINDTNGAATTNIGTGTTAGAVGIGNGNNTLNVTAGTTNIAAAGTGVTNIGTAAGAGAVTIGRAGGTLTLASPITANALLTGTAGMTVTGGAVQLNASTANTTTIGNGTNALALAGNADINLNNAGATTNIGTGTTTGAVSIGGGANQVVVNSTTWDISGAGVASGLTGLTTTGSVNLTGATLFGASPIVFDGSTVGSGVTTLAVTDPGVSNYTITLPAVTGTVITTGNLTDITNVGTLGSGLTAQGAAVNLNAGSNFPVNIATGGSTGAVSIGGGANTVAVNSTTWDITGAGVLTGVAAGSNVLVNGGNALGATVSAGTTDVQQFIVRTGNPSLARMTFESAIVGPNNVVATMNGGFLAFDTAATGIRFQDGTTLTTASANNAFGNIAVPNGTQPVADIPMDTLTLTSTGTTMTITGTAGTDTVNLDVAADSINGTQLVDAITLDAAFSLNGNTIDLNNTTASAVGIGNGVANTPVNIGAGTSNGAIAIGNGANTLTVASGTTTITSGNANINTSAAGNTNIGTGTNTGTVNIGTGANSGAVGIGRTGQTLTINSTTNIGANLATTGGATITSAGLLTGSAGLTVTGATNINVNNNAATNIGTGSTNVAVNIGGNSNNVVIDANNWDVTNAGAATFASVTGTGNVNSSGGTLQTAGTTRIDNGGNATLGTVSATTLSGRFVYETPAAAANVNLAADTVVAVIATNAGAVNVAAAVTNGRVLYIRNDDDVATTGLVVSAGKTAMFVGVGAGWVKVCEQP